MKERTMQELAFLRNQASQLQQQIVAITRMVQENEAASQGLDNLQSLKKETLFQLGAGVFMKGKATDDSKVLLEIGARVASEKTVEEAKKMLADRKKELEEALRQSELSYQKVAEAMDEVSEKARLEEQG